MSVQQEETQTLLDKTASERAKESLYEAYVASKKALVDVKDVAYEKIVATEQTVAEGAQNAYNSAWVTYEDAKHKVWDFGKASLDSANKNYEVAKVSLVETSTKLQDFFREYKSKASERTSEAYQATLAKLEQAQAEAALKYNSARDTLTKLYDDAHQEAQKDYLKAQQYFKVASEKAKKFSEDAQLKTQQNYEATKKQLEAARLRAQEGLQNAKIKAEEIKQQVSDFNSSMLIAVQGNYELMKVRASEAADALNSYKNDLHINETVKAKLQLAADSASENLKKAEDALLQAKDRVAQFGKETAEAVRQATESKGAL